MSTTGVPSNASIGPICTRVPSISRTMMGYRPSEFGCTNKATGRSERFVGEARRRAYQTSLRKTSSIVASNAFSLKGLMSTVAFTRLKKNSMAGLFG